MWKAIRDDNSPLDVVAAVADLSLLDTQDQDLSLCVVCSFGQQFYRLNDKLSVAFALTGCEVSVSLENLQTAQGRLQDLPSLGANRTEERTLAVQPGRGGRPLTVELSLKPDPQLTAIPGVAIKAAEPAVPAVSLPTTERFTPYRVTRAVVQAGREVRCQYTAEQAQPVRPLHGADSFGFEATTSADSQEQALVGIRIRIPSSAQIHVSRQDVLRKARSRIRLFPAFLSAALEDKVFGGVGDGAGTVFSGRWRVVRNG